MTWTDEKSGEGAKKERVAETIIRKARRAVLAETRVPNEVVVVDP